MGFCFIQVLSIILSLFFIIFHFCITLLHPVDVFNGYAEDVRFFLFEDGQITFDVKVGKVDIKQTEIQFYDCDLKSFNSEYSCHMMAGNITYNDDKKIFYINDDAEIFLDQLDVTVETSSLIYDTKTKLIQSFDLSYIRREDSTISSTGFIYDIENAKLTMQKSKFNLIYSEE